MHVLDYDDYPFLFYTICCQTKLLGDVFYTPCYHVAWRRSNAGSRPALVQAAHQALLRCVFVVIIVVVLQFCFVVLLGALLNLLSVFLRR